MELEQVKGLLETHEKALEKALEKYHGQLDTVGTVANEVKAEVKALAEQHKTMSDRLIAIEQKGVKMEQKPAAKSLGEMFLESDSFKAMKAGGGRARWEKSDWLMKNTITGETNSNPNDILVPYDAMPGIVPGAFRQLRVMDVVPTGVTSSNTVHYTRELTWTNDAAETAENAVKPESDLTFEDVDVPVRTIAHFIYASKQVLDDAPALRSYIDRRLTHGLQVRLENQVIAGNGVAPNISGILNNGNYTLFSPTAGESALDTLNRAKYAAWAADYPADVIMMNPAAWGSLERTKAAASGNGYAGGDGAGMAYINNGLTPTIWGLPVVVSNAIPNETFIMLSRAAIMFWQRAGIMVEAFEQDGDNVRYNRITIRAEMRGAFSVFRPAAVQAGNLIVSA